MATYKYFSYDNFLYFYTKLKLKFQAINMELNNKVDKVEGKGLSTNDLTDALVEKINNAGDSSFTGDYDDLTGKPAINNVTLASGNNTLATLGIQPAGNYLTETDIADMATQTDIADMATKTDIADMATKTDIANMATQSDIANMATQSDIADFITMDDVEALDYATETYVDTAVSGLVNSAPAALDTLKELADALGNDANFATTVTTALGNKVNTSDLVPMTNAEIDAIMDGTVVSA